MSWPADLPAVWLGRWAVIERDVAVVAILGMALVTYLSRVAGLWIMAFVPVSGRVERALKALSGSVLVALVVPAALAGDTGLKLGVAVAAILMVRSGNSLLSMTLGVAVAAGYRSI